MSKIQFFTKVEPATCAAFFLREKKMHAGAHVKSWERDSPYGGKIHGFVVEVGQGRYLRLDGSIQ